MRDIVFFLFFLPFVYLAFRMPFLGICAWIWTVLLVPKNMLFGFAADLRFTYILAIVTIISLVINRDPFLRKPGGTLYVLMLLFLLQSSISNMFSIGIPVLGWAVWSDFFKAMMLATFILMMLNTRNRIETFIKLMLVGAGFNIGFEALKFLVTAGSYRIPGILNSMLTDNNLLALGVLMMLPLFIYITPTLKTKTLRLAFLGFSGLCAVCVIGTFSRGGFIGLLIVGWRLLQKSKKKILFGFIGIVFASGAIFVAADGWKDRMETIDDAKSDASFLGRTTAWKISTLVALDRPLIGGGQDSVQTFQVWDYYYREIDKLDFLDLANAYRYRPKAAHSIYFQVLGDTGIPGILLFLGILFMGYRMSKRLSKHAHQDWIRDLASAINTMLLAYMVSGTLLSMAYYDVLYAMLAVLICIDRLNKQDIENLTRFTSPDKDNN